MSEFSNNIRIIADGLIEKINTVVDRYDEALSIAQKVVEEINSNPELQTPFKMAESLSYYEQTDARRKEIERREKIADNILRSYNIVLRDTPCASLLVQGEDAFSTIFGQILIFDFGDNLEMKASIRKTPEAKTYMYRVLPQILKQADLK
jgi:hypothetical protein